MSFPSPTSYRPPIVGSKHMASTGHYLATMAAIRILERGGNAFDAGVAAGLCINVVQPDMTNIGGVAPAMIYEAASGHVSTVSGLGYWPAATDINYFIDECGNSFPPGLRRCVMPAAIDTWLTTLSRWGTMTFREVSEPAIELAADGFAIYPFLHASIVEAAQQLVDWPGSARIFLNDGDVPGVGTRLQQFELASTFRALGDVERSAGGSRENGIQAARDHFYKGDVAEQIASFMNAHDGWMTTEDLANFSVEIDEKPPTVTYRGHDVYGCAAWCQGPVALETLSILEGYDLARLGANSSDSLHLIIEALKAAFADREHFLGDPNFIDVPIEGMLSREYAAQWRERISLNRASPGMPDAGNPWQFMGRKDVVLRRRARAFAAAVEPDTSFVCVIDSAGNAIAATPSDGFGGSPIIPGLGFAISSRGSQSWLDPEHPSAVAPGKRPRLTPNPGMVMKDGAIFAPYGTPGNDTQPQAMVQFLVNLLDHQMNPQEAVEAPRVATYSFPRSSHPHPYTPGLTYAEARIPASTIDELRQRGHDVQLWPQLAAPAGSVCAIVRDLGLGFLTGAADPRRLAYAIGW
jgi:gamma-glutamyltranspeptidase / glutathione hydrolase